MQPRDTLPYCLRRHISCRYLYTSTYYSLLSAFSDLDPPTQVHPGHEDHPTDESATITRLATPWAKLSTSLDLYPWQSGDKDPAPLSCDSPTRDAGRQYASEKTIRFGECFSIGIEGRRDTLLRGRMVQDRRNAGTLEWGSLVSHTYTRIEDFPRRPGHAPHLQRCLPIYSSAPIHPSHTWSSL